jgi:threonine dehydrogenase-like Zn-dependent dehydrogenase
MIKSLVRHMRQRPASIWVHGYYPSDCSPGHEDDGALVELSSKMEGFKKRNNIMTLSTLGCGHGDACLRHFSMLFENVSGASSSRHALDSLTTWGRRHFLMFHVFTLLIRRDVNFGSAPDCI